MRAYGRRRQLRLLVAQDPPTRPLGFVFHGVPALGRLVRHCRRHSSSTDTHALAHTHMTRTSPPPHMHPHGCCLASLRCSLFLSLPTCLH